jgi:hypothetical protein
MSLLSRELIDVKFKTRSLLVFFVCAIMFKLNCLRIQINNIERI